MNARSLLLVGLAAGALAPLGVAQAAPARTPARAPERSAPAAAETPVTQGPPITGFCTFSMNQIIATSKVGQSVETRLKQLDQQWRAELQPEAEAINNEKRTLDSQAPTLDAATYQARQANLQLRATNFEKREQLRVQEMQATQNKEVGVIQRELNPILRDLYEQHRCSILVERESGGVAVVNPAMDLSDQAVVSLNGRIQTLTFDRVNLENQAGAAAPAAAH